MSLQYVSCDCDQEESEFARYKPDYVESYMEHRLDADQTIAEWTEAEGKYIFTGDEIYDPVQIPVAIQGRDKNTFCVDVSRKDWFKSLHSAIANTLIGAGIAKQGDAIALTDIRGNSLEGCTEKQLEQASAIYPTVNGVRTIDMPGPAQSARGCPIATPITHTLDRQERLRELVQDVCQEAKLLVIKNLSEASSTRDIDARLTDDNGLKASIAALVLERAGLPTLKDTIATFADADVVSALDDGRVDAKSVAAEIADIILDRVAATVASNIRHVNGFYDAQEYKASINARIGNSVFGSSPLSPSSSSQSSRTVFKNDEAKKTQQAFLEEIMRNYPTALKLQKNIAAQAFDDSAELLGHDIVISIKKGHKEYRCSCMRKTARAGRGAHIHKHADSHEHCLADERLERRHKTRIMDPENRKFVKNLARMLRVMRRSNSLRGYPQVPAPHVKAEKKTVATLELNPPPQTPAKAQIPEKIEASLGKVTPGVWGQNVPGGFADKTYPRKPRSSQPDQRSAKKEDEEEDLDEETGLRKPPGVQSKLGGPPSMEPLSVGEGIPSLEPVARRTFVVAEKKTTESSDAPSLGAIPGIQTQIASKTTTEEKSAPSSSLAQIAMEVKRRHELARAHAKVAAPIQVSPFVSSSTEPAKPIDAEVPSLTAFTPAPKVPAPAQETKVITEEASGLPSIDEIFSSLSILDGPTKKK